MYQAVRRRAQWAFVSTTALALAGVVSAAPGDTYYVSPTGSDSGDGLTPQTAWKSVAKVNDTTFAPGSQILFQSGGQWHESLEASSSGTANAPIVYGAYGDGAKPKFWGSDPVANSSFFKITGTTSTYRATVDTPVNAFLGDHNFYHDASTLTGSTDGSVNRAYVDAHPNTWAYVGTSVYVNTGGSNPTQDGKTYTAAVRDDVVNSNQKNNLVFKDLVVDESAKVNAGYAFRIDHSDNVVVEDSEAYRAGKHDFGVINSNNFVAQRLYTSSSMPDQGYGGATAYVAFSDGNAGTHDSSQWIDCVADNNGGVYPAFYTHGVGVGDVLVKNMTVHGGPGIAISTDAPYKQNVRVEGGTLDNAGIILYGHDTVVDGVHITGPTSLVDLGGQDNVLQNMLVTGVKPVNGYYAAIVDHGKDNTLQFNTVVLDPTSPGYSAALSLLNDSTNTRLVGNIFDTPATVIRNWFYDDPSIEANYNLYSPGAQVLSIDVAASIAQWKAEGYDINSLLADPKFANVLAGDYALTPGSAGVDGIAPGLLDDTPSEDFAGVSRAQGAGLDIGAFETAVPEPALCGVAVVGALGMLTSRRRRRPA